MFMLYNYVCNIYIIVHSTGLYYYVMYL